MKPAQTMKPASKISQIKDKITKRFPSSYLFYQKYLRFHTVFPKFQSASYPNRTYRVLENIFWDEFEQGWEPQTFKVFQAHLTQDTDYIDLGAFIGPTMLLAGDCGCRHIYCIEANPLAFGQLQANYDYNQAILPPANFENLCIYDKSGEQVWFGGRDYSAACSIRGSRWQIETVSISDLLDRYKLKGKLFIKIDIEGAETKILSDLGNLANRPDTIVYLSLHPPFWEKREKIVDRMIETLYHFDVHFSDLESISPKKLHRMIMSDSDYPYWGSRFGNFFEIVLASKI